MAKELKGTKTEQNLLEAFAGESMARNKYTYFASKARKDGYEVIQWNVDSLDWKNLGVEPMIQRTTKDLHPGDILLFHNNSQYITQALPAIIESIQSQGYQIVPISELVLSQPYWIDHTGMQHAGNAEGGNGQ